MSLNCVIEEWTKTKGEIRVSELLKKQGKYPYAILYGNGNYTIYGNRPIKTFNNLPPEYTFERRGTTPPFFPDFIGFLTYEYAYRFDTKLPSFELSDFPHALFFLFEKTIVFDRKNKTIFQCKRRIENPDTLYPINQYSQAFSAKFAKSTETEKTYREKVAFIKGEIKKGNVYQVNLTRQEEWEFTGNVKEFALNLYSLNPAEFSAILEFTFNGKKHAIISSSPERFFKISGNTIISEPIKGTINREENSDGDEYLKNQLLNSEKDLAELAMITDLIRNDLTMVCRCPSVYVEKYPALMELTNVFHLYSIIKGNLKERDMEKIFRKIFPGGSITGCPKLAAMNYIYQLEKMPRHIYTGSIGWFKEDGTQADFNIAIRTAYTIENKLYFGVGGGIVIDSDEKKEYLETVYKAKSIRKCLENS